jgi:hypothetical protein
MFAVAGLVSGFYLVTFFGLILIIGSLISRQKTKQKETKVPEVSQQQEYEAPKQEDAQEEMRTKQTQTVTDVLYITPALFPEPILPPISPMKEQRKTEEEKRKDEEVIELLLFLSVLRLLS